MLNKNLVMGSILLLSSCHSGFGSSAQDIRTSAQNSRTKLVVDLPATTNPELNTQKIFSVADQSEFSTQIKLKNENGFVLWKSTNILPLANQGKTIEKLKPTRDLPANAFAYQTRSFPVFNAKGDGFFVWLGPPNNSYPDPPPPFDSFSLRTIQQFKSTETVTNIPGIVHEGNIDEQGRGSLYWFQYLDFKNSMNPTFDLWRYPIENYQLKSQPELLELNLSEIPFIKTDGQGNGFRLQKKTNALYRSDLPYATLIYLNNHKPTGEILELFNNEALSGPSISVHDGNGSLIYPENGLSEIRKWSIYPVKNYRVNPDEKRQLTLNDSQAPSRYSTLSLSSKGNGLLAVLEPFGEIRIRLIKNFQFSGPYYRLAQAAPVKADYVERIVGVQIQLSEDGNGLIVWQQQEEFKDQMVETEPGVKNSHKQNHVYIRPVRNFQPW